MRFILTNAESKKRLVKTQAEMCQDMKSQKQDKCYCFGPNVCVSSSQLHVTIVTLKDRGLGARAMRGAWFMRAESSQMRLLFS